MVVRSEPTPSIIDSAGVDGNLASEFEGEDRVSRCGSPRKTQFEGSLPWITGALPGSPCESASPTRSSQNNFKPAPPRPQHPQVRSRDLPPTSRWPSVQEIMSTLGSVVARKHSSIRYLGLRRASPDNPPRLPWASTACSRVHDNLRGKVLCTVMIFFGELFTPDSIDSTGKALAGTRRRHSFPCSSWARSNNAMIRRNVGLQRVRHYSKTAAQKT